MTEMRRLLDAHSSGTLPVDWVAAAARIEAEREAIEHHLADQRNVRVYGFNTLLGPLDDEPAREGYQVGLLDAHLVGHPVTAPTDLPRLATLVKICQLAKGGSGISGPTYARLVSHAFDQPSSQGAWWHSYSSGDVVPAAWWVVSVFGVEAVRDFAPGDLIALINGNFMSTAAALMVFQRGMDLLSTILCHAARICAPPVVAESIPTPLRGVLEEIATTSIPRSIQVPVSERDYGPLAAGAVVAMRTLVAAIESRLARPSGNPIFSFGDGKVAPRSQSSFLDVVGTMALESMSTAVAFALCALQRFTERESLAGIMISRDRMEFVQPPKVSMAILQQGLAAASGPRIAPLAESGGVEDLADGSLNAARSALDLIDRGSEMVDLYVSVNPAASDYTSLTARVRDALVDAAFSAEN